MAVIGILFWNSSRAWRRGELEVLERKILLESNARLEDEIVVRLRAEHELKKAKEAAEAAAALAQVRRAAQLLPADPALFGNRDVSLVFETLWDEAVCSWRIYANTRSQTAQVFFGGSTGVIYRQFSITMVSAPSTSQLTPPNDWSS